ncbi:MAG: ABC transporter [Chloroflexi bacterium RBG_16_57_11]|nr:MAG: ABC transporter [Chloroflexi bacterium RBG_16_57_11]
MIEAEALCKQFDGFTAVDEVSLNLEKGEVLALLGPNGAGKTTTVRMLSSVLRPTRGTAKIAGYDVVHQAREVRAAVGVLTENHGLYNRMPADDYLDFFGQIYHLNRLDRQARTRQLLEQFGLMEHAHRPIGEFSKGMRQKLALARALLHNPPVLLLDEPTSAMDPESARLVRNSILDLRSAERTIIICTHNLAEADELADLIAIIRHGRIIAQGKSDDLKDRLLGPTVYELRLANHLNGALPPLPDGVAIIAQGENWIRFHSQNPHQYNPFILQCFLHSGLQVVSLQEAPRNLEQVYLQAIKE